MSETDATSGKASWKLDETAPERAAALRKALRSVQDPELGYSVIELGLIRDVFQEESRVTIAMILTTPFCPYAGQLVDEVRQTATKTLETEIAVDLRFDPWDPNMMEEGIDLNWGLF